MLMFGFRRISDLIWAAEIAGMNRWQFQDHLAQRGIPIVIEADEADARAQSQRIRDKYL